MNLTASNEAHSQICGDIAKFPFVGQWRSLVLGAGHVVSWSWEDLRVCFYLLKLPSCWARHFVFD